MKKFYLALTAFLLLAFNALSAKGYTTISKYGYEISFPSSWYIHNIKASYNKPILNLRSSGPTGGVMAIEIVDNYKKRYFTLEEFIEKELKRYKNNKRFTEYKIINKLDASYNGLNYKEVTFSYVSYFQVNKGKSNALYSKSNEVITQRYYKKNNKIYRITLLLNQESSSTLRAEAIQILNSFKFK